MSGIQFIENFLNVREADELLRELSTYDFKRYDLNIGGKTVKPLRGMIAFADSDDLKYEFSGLTLPLNSWTECLLNLKAKVEEKTNCRYNYGLLNFYENGNSGIGMHRDAEASLAPDMPVTSVSLGSTRTMQFSHRTQPAFELKLSHGSLLIMKEDGLKLWAHGISREPEINMPRISVTFRCIVPKRSACPDEENGFKKKFEDLFVDLMPARDIYKKEIGENFFLNAAYFKNTVKIHIRKYVQNSENKLVPTKIGITMDLLTWHAFQQKLYGFNVLYKSASFVANNVLLVLSKDKQMVLQLLYTQTPPLAISENVFLEIQEQVSEMNECLIEFLMKDYLCYMTGAQPLIPFDDDHQTVQLLLALEQELCIIFKEYFECDGCLVSHNSQRRHSCLKNSDYEKFQLLGNNILLAANWQAVATRFLEKIPTPSEDFFANLNPSLITSILFKSCK